MEEYILHAEFFSRHNNFVEKEISENFDNIRKFALIELLLDSGSDAEQWLVYEVSDFNPNFVQYNHVNIFSGKFNDKGYYCKYMTQFNFCEGIITTYCGQKHFIVTNLYPKKYCFGKLIDFDTYKDILYSRLDKLGYSKEIWPVFDTQLGKQYEDYCNGNIIFWQHIDYKNFILYSSPETCEMIDTNNIDNNAINHKKLKFIARTDMFDRSGLY